MANPGYVFNCVPDPNRTCLQQFLEDRFELTYVYVKPDGDCFFNSIAEYYKRTGEQIDGLDPTDAVALRLFIMERARPIIDENEAMRQQILAEDLNMQKRSLKHKKKSAPKKLSQKKEETNDERLDNIFNKLSERYEYEHAAFDVIVQITPFILNVNLSIYSMTYGTVSNTLHRAQDPDAPTIILYLSGVHYGLLYPIDGPNIRSNAQKRENMRADKHKHNQNNATKALIQKLIEQSNSNQNSENERNAQKAKKASRKKGAPVRQSRKASHYNNSNSNNSIAELEREIAAIEAKSKAKAPRNNNFNAALAESLGAVSLNNGLNNDMRAAIEASFQNVSFSSRNNRNKLVQQHALNRSMRQNNSSNSNSNVPVNSVEFKQLTVATLKNKLTSMGVPFGSKNLKASLYQKYKKATRKKK